MKLLPGLCPVPGTLGVFGNPFVVGKKGELFLTKKFAACVNGVFCKRSVRQYESIQGEIHREGNRVFFRYVGGSECAPGFIDF
jgi:hypothetical protein